MAAAQARQLHRQTGARVRIVDGKGRARWHELWEGLPYLTQQPSGLSLLNCSGARPYIDYTRTTPQRWAYTDWRCTPGEIANVTPNPEATQCIVIEPNIKPNASPNKQWGAGNWLALMRMRPHWPWVQACPPGQPAISGARRIETRTFRDACGVLLAARAAVLPEGGLHHAAAALGRRAVVLFGGMTSPRNTGYDLHENLWIDDPEALGWRIRSPACERAWAQITPERVMAQLEKVLAEP